jgi:hypothetical protein
MKILRFVLVLAVIGYAGWLAWPFISPFFEGAEPTVATERASAMVEAGGGIPQAALWIGAVVFYLIAAFMLGSGNPKAVAAYFLGFLADAVLRLAIDRSSSSGPASVSIQAETYAGGGEIARRSAEVVAPAGLPVDPTWLILGVLLLVGLIIAAVSRRRRRQRQAGHLTV